MASKVEQVAKGMIAEGTAISALPRAEWWKVKAAAAIAAYEAALEGWVIVPCVPTETMVAEVEEVDRAASERSLDSGGAGAGLHWAEGYAVMIGAAPTAALAEEED